MKIQNGNYLIKWQKQKLKPIKRVDNSSHLPPGDFVRAFSFVEQKLHGKLNLVLKLTKPHPCMTVL